MSSIHTLETPLYLMTDEPGVYLAEISTHDITSIESTIAAATLDYPTIDITHDTSRRLLGVWDDDTLVGAVSLKEDESEGANVIDFWTNSDFANLGYATIAIQAATKYALQDLPKVRAHVGTTNEMAKHILEKVGYSQVANHAGELTFENSITDFPALNAGVLKMRATNGADGSRGGTDSAVIEQDSDAIGRMIRKFSGTKNRAMQDALGDAVAYLTNNPLSLGSEKVQGIGGNEPTVNGGRVSVWRLKPSDVPTLKSGLLRNIRIVYGMSAVDGKNILAIMDIIQRGDFAKKYN